MNILSEERFGRVLGDGMHHGGAINATEDRGLPQECLLTRLVKIC